MFQNFTPAKTLSRSVNALKQLPNGSKKVGTFKVAASCFLYLLRFFVGLLLAKLAVLAVRNSFGGLEGPVERVL